MTRTKVVTKSIRVVEEFRYGAGASARHSHSERVTVVSTVREYMSDTIYSMKDIMDSYQEYRRNCCDNNY